jgi:hypothetical protein
MNIGSSTPLQQLTPLTERFSINDVRTLVAKQLRVDIEFVTSETHFTNDLGADLLDQELGERFSVVSVLMFGGRYPNIDR